MDGDKDSGIVSFAEVLAREFQTIRARRRKPGDARTNAAESDARPENLFGIGLSGGGIRSASFCLGALQALDGFGLIRRADYLSTVSGGGYIGAGLVAAMTGTKESPAPFPYAADAKSASTPKEADLGSGNDMRDSEAVSHLRDHSRYLIPHGLPDILVSAAIVTRGIAVNFFLIFFVLMPLATITVLANPTVDHLGHSVLYDIARQYLPPWPWLDWINNEPFLATKVLGALGLLYFVGWGLWRSLPERHGIFSSRAARNELKSKGVTAATIIILLLLSVAALELQGPVLEWLALKQRLAPDGQSSYQTFFIALAAIATATASQQKRLAGWIERGLNSPRFALKLRSVLSHLLLIAVALIVPLLIYVLYLQISLWGISSVQFCAKGQIALTPCMPADSPGFIASGETTRVLQVVTGFLLVWGGFIYLGRQKGRDMLQLLGRRFADPATRTIPIGLSLLVFGVFLVLSFYATRSGISGNTAENAANSSTVALNYVLMSVIVILLTVNFENNANSLHRLYRDRLNVAFRLSGKDRSLGLQDLGDEAPYLLINATLNARLSQGRLDAAQSGSQANSAGRTRRAPDPAMRGRNAEFFLFSKHFIGSDTTLYADTKLMSAKEPELNLASAVAISGAAVSSNMGRVGLGLLSPTLALLNLRLGYWLNNPRYVATPTTEMRSDLPWHDFLGAYLIAESFGLLRADSSKVYITDGGHIDNIGLYQLLKRQCDQIIIIDAESDPALNFGALVDVQRFARIDLGYRITLDWSHLRDAAVAREANKGKRLTDASAPVHDCHFATGSIDYGNGKKGRLLYVKAIVTGDEPDYVLDYERRYPAFPHEATNDQFFSEEQMEAYRSLGFHAMRRALSEPKVEIPPAVIPEARQSLMTWIKETKRQLGVTVPQLS